MPYEAEIVAELETYFRSIGIETRRNKQYYYDIGFVRNHSFVEVDLVIKKDEIEIPIEVKAQDTGSIYKGIGQALAYLIFLPNLG